MKNIHLLIGTSVLFAFSALSCSTTAQRAFVRRDASVLDYEYFPSRLIKADSSTKEFEKELDPKAEKILLQAFGEDSIEHLIKKTKSQAFIIVKDDKIILEEYTKGYDKNSTVTSFSCAKSFDSAMVGSLIDQGILESEEEPITNYLPELKKRDRRFERITIRHLMEMSSGISYDEVGYMHDGTKTYFDPDLRNLALTETKIEENPGLHFLYNNYNPILLGLIIERASGMSVSEFLEKNIWTKMGATSNASWSLDSDEDAFEKMESGINATARDFVKFGCLYRDWGMACGKQVISRKWIEESLSDKKYPASYYSKTIWGRKILGGANGNGGHYGYFWYVMHRPSGEDDFFAFGNKGQIIYVNRNTDTVIARFGFKYAIGEWDYINAFYYLSEKL